MKEKTKNGMFVAGNLFYATTLIHIIMQLNMPEYLILILLGYFFCTYERY